MRTIKNIWMLDVDGVINCQSPRWHSAPFKSTVFNPEDDRSYTFCWAPQLINHIRNMHLGNLVEIRWASSWNRNIEYVEEALKLPPLPVAFTEYDVFDPFYEKLNAVRAELLEGNRVMWTDDDIDLTDRSMNELNKLPGKLSVVVPDSRHGLLPGDLDRIRSFFDLRP